MKRVSAMAVITCMMVGLMIPTSASAKEDYYEYCKEIGDMYCICPELLQAIISCESSYNPDATSSQGAQGLCQIIPKYQTERMERLGVTDLYDPYSNILVCADILDELIDKYEDPYLVMMCYNEGEYGTAVERFENGNYSKYAKKVMEKSYELERAHGK